MEEKKEYWRWLMAEEGTEALDAACKLMAALKGKVLPKQLLDFRDELRTAFDICPACCIPTSVCGCEDPPTTGTDDSYSRRP